MDSIAWQIPETVLIRPLDGETLVVQLQTGAILYCDSAAEAFFDFFRVPRRYSDYAQAVGWNSEVLESEDWENWISFLQSNQLIEVRGAPDTSPAMASEGRTIPTFLRHAPGDLKLSTAYLASTDSSTSE